jgi:phospholipid/cholesterol/gamma-HCH transport system substrate-binding protein
VKLEARNKVKAFWFGIVGLLIVAFVTYVSAKAPTGLPWSASTSVKAEFADVSTLRPGDAVRENSVRIGRIASVEYDGGRAVVTMRLEGDQDVHADARAAIYDETSLAKKFVELHPGTKGTLDGPIKDTATVSAADLDEALSTFDHETRSRLQTAVTELGTGAAGHSQGLHAFLSIAPDLLEDADTVLTTVNADDTDLAGLITNADRFAAAFRGQQERLEHLVTTSAETLDAFAADNGKDLESTVGELPDTLEQADSSLTALNPTLKDTRQAMTALRPGAEALGDATPDLRAVLRDAVEPLDKVPAVSKQATPAVEDLTDLAQDARPLAPRLSTALTNAAPILDTLGPYSKDIVSFFGHANSLVSQTVGPDPDSHVARLGVALPGTSIVSGYLVQDPGLVRIPYPKPGTAYTHAVKGLPNVTPLGELTDLSFLSGLPGLKLPGYDGGN